MPSGVHDFSYEGGGFVLDDDGTFRSDDFGGEWTWSQNRCFCVQPYGQDQVICDAVGSCQSCFDEPDSTVPTHNPDIIPTTMGVEDACSDPVLTRTAPLPRGSYPSWFINGINAEPPQDGFVLRLRSNGTFTGNWGNAVSATDIELFQIAYDTCGVGTRAPALAGHWVYTSDDCFCQRYDILPSQTICLSFPDLARCYHHERNVASVGEARVSAEKSVESNGNPLYWDEVDMGNLLEEIPEASNEIYDILTELE